MNSYLLFYYKNYYSVPNMPLMQSNSTSNASIIRADNVSASILLPYLVTKGTFGRL